MRFTKLQLIIITLCVFALASAGFRYLLSRSEKIESNQEKNTIENSTTIESKLDTPKSFPLEKAGLVSESEKTDSKLVSNHFIDGKLDLNSATRAELLSLKELNNSQIDAIITHREEGQKFQKLDELSQLPEISQMTLDKIRSDVIVLSNEDNKNATASYNKSNVKNRNKHSNSKSTHKRKRRKEHLIKVNINFAQSKELQTLPGIGPKTAAKIIKFRTEHGFFADIKQIVKIKGIGKKSFEKIKDFITISE